MLDENWAIIPARGGSKGVPNKNIKSLKGLPLIGYSIHVLKKTKLFDKIIVTSDDDEILEVAKSLDAEIFKRTDPEESNDFTMPDVPVLSFLDRIESKKLPKFTFMVQCSAPFIKAESYKKAFDLLKHIKSGTVFAAHISHSFLWKPRNNTDKDYLPINHPFHERLGRQYLKEEQLCETGAFYGFKTKEFVKARHRFYTKAYPVKIYENEIHDINDKNDWNYAEYIIDNFITE